MSASPRFRRCSRFCAVPSKETAGKRTGCDGGRDEIVFHYPDIDRNNGLTDGQAATVGIAGADGVAAGRFLQWSFNSSIDGVRNLTFTPGTPIPEPSTYARMGAGFAALALLRRRDAHSPAPPDPAAAETLKLMPRG